MLNSAEHENFPAHKCKKRPTVVGILAFMSRINSILGLSLPEKVEFLDIFILMSTINKFHGQLSTIFFNNLGA